MSVRSLQKIANLFVIARAFNKYGHITDVSDQSLSLRVEYPAGAVQKTFMNYVFKLPRLTVKGGVVSVDLMDKFSKLIEHICIFYLDDLPEKCRWTV